MDNLASPKVIKDIIEKYGFRFSKSLGQNFLIDGNIVRKIVEYAEVSKEDYVLEIGPGIGTLTQVLCEKAKKVVSVEIDSKLIPMLMDNLKEYDNFILLHNDILKIDINNIIQNQFEGKKIKVVANLPYYVTTPIIMELLEKKLNISSITVMIQKEVAKRLQAEPGNKDYGALSVSTQYYCEPKIGFLVSKNCFMPAPKVDSVVIKLNVMETPKVDVSNEKLFFNIIRASFGQRRKTLINSLGNSKVEGMNKELVKNILDKFGISEQIRGESLTIEQFAQLTNMLS